MVGFIFPASSPANGVWHVGAERDTAHAVAADGLLLRIDRFPIGVVAGYVNRTAASCRSNSVTSHVSVASEHEHIVSERLEVVTCSISRDVTAIMKLRRLNVCSLWQVTSEAAWVP